MTELRSRPGEILDRVADDGDAFIIERNGRRTACLVPLSIFFPDVSPARIADEIKELADQAEQCRVRFTESRELAFQFQHSLSDDAQIEIAIILPHGYPHSCPRIYAEPIAKEAPHRWSDGALCLFGVMSGWNPGRHTVYSTLMLARQWLGHYDIWRKSGHWPKQEGPASE